MAQRRHVLTRVSDETGAVLSGASAFVLRAGARVTQVQAISANSTATVKLRHPGALKLNDVVWVVRDDALEASTSLQYRVNSTPSYNSGVWDVTLLDLTGSDGGVNANDRLVLDYTDSDHYVTWYTDDTTTSGTSGALSVSTATGKVEFYVEEPDVDVAVVVSGSATYFTDLVAGTRPFVTPEEFGAVGDGVTDDSNAVQAALDYVSEVAGGGVVWFGSGDGYSVTGVSATSADVQLAGYSVPVGISGGKPRVLFGSGSPESAVTAPIGSIYLRSDQATGIPQLYAKETGTGNGGWREVNSTSGLVVNADLSMGGYDIVLTDNVIFTQGSGSPESVVTASIGSLYLDKTNGVAYIKESGSGNTGWDAVNTDALPLAGGTMTGNVDLNGNDITMGGGNIDTEGGQLISTDGTTTWVEFENHTADLTVPLTRTAKPSAGGPDLIAINSTTVNAYGFDPTTAEELFFIAELPYSWVAGTDITPKLHWMPTSTSTNNVRWSIDIHWINEGAAASVVTTYSVTDAGNGTAWENQEVTFSAIGGSGKTEGAILMGRFYRDAGNAADTYPDDAIALVLDFEITVNRIGK